MSWKHTLFRVPLNRVWKIWVILQTYSFALSDEEAAWRWRWGSVGGGCYIKGNIRMHHFKLWMLHWGVVGIVLCTLGGGCYIKRATHACISALCISAHCGLFYFALRDRWCWQLTIESNERMHRPCSMSSAHVLTGGLHCLVRWCTDFAILQCHKSGKRKTTTESRRDSNMELVGLANGLTGWMEHSCIGTHTGTPCLLLLHKLTLEEFPTEWLFSQHILLMTYHW